MSDTVSGLKMWFENLSRDQQVEVLEFLYGGKVLLRKGLYCGPKPGLVDDGFHCGGDCARISDIMPKICADIDARDYQVKLLLEVLVVKVCTRIFGLNITDWDIFPRKNIVGSSAGNAGWPCVHK